MSHKFLNIIILMFILVPAKPGLACEPVNNFLFKEEARKKLASLTENNPGDIFDRIILLHNLAFHKDKKSRQKAEELLKRTKPDKTQIHLFKAYQGSLNMIKVSHSNTTSKILKTINPFNKSPKEEALNGFSLISAAVNAEPENKIIRCLRATAASESLEHLPELFETAKTDLHWLDSCIMPDDSVSNFLVNLNWAKYYYKLWHKMGNSENLKKSEISCTKAIDFACTPVYSQWAQDWQNRIKSSINENK